MSDSPKCPKCGAELPQDAPAGLCPKCLVKAGFQSQAPPKSDPEAPTAPSPAPSGFVPPEVMKLAGKFPQLEILELLGQGGMGAVYKARQTNLDRLVALKIIRPGATHDPAFAERFNREAKTLARLGHQHIVAVYDFGEVDFTDSADGQTRPLYFFIMEYVDGANLRQLMQADQLAPEQALAIVPQICDALQFAHDEGVVHRDIKPENILLDKQGRVKIADFGLAKLTTRSPEEFTLTGTHQVMGTFRYMAPEQMEGSHAVDHRADIYSLGVVFYEMLTGQVPAGHFDPPSKKVEVDVRLDEVVLRALAREPERRYQQASEVKSEVESISNTMSPKPAPSMIDATAADDPEIEAARERVQWPGIGLMVVGVLSTIVVLMAWSTNVWLTTRPDDYLASQAVQRAKTIADTLFPITAVLALVIVVGAWKMLQLTSRRWAIAASVLAVSPIPSGPFWPLSLPLGIWALVVLNRPQVRAAFAHIQQEAVRPSGTGGLPAPARITEPNGESIRQLIAGPVAALTLVAVAGVALGINGIISFIQQTVRHWAEGVDNSADYFLPAFTLFFAIILLVDAVKMSRCERYEWAIGGSVIAIALAVMLAVSTHVALLLGSAAGIWALVVLNRPDVKAMFRRKKELKSGKGAEKVERVRKAL